MRGMFIVFEGLDRCGKTTQAQLLASALQPAKLFHFPDRSTPIGAIIDSYLTGGATVDDRVLHLLFTANRWEFASSITQSLEQGIHVIVDRYIYSGIAFSAAKGIPADWAVSIEKDLPLPDIVLYMDMSVDKTMLRVNFGDERYETTDFQAVVYREFGKMLDRFEVIDADRSIPDIHADIIARLNEYMNKS